MLIGNLEIVALADGRGPFLPWTEAFPSATAEEWALAMARDPAAFAPDGRWRLDFRCFAILGAGVTLVDLGIGHADAPANSWAPVPGRLPAALADAGIAPSDVDTVVLTHLHADHCGWAVTPAGEPMFPNARHVVQRDELRAVSPAVTAHAVTPLRAGGLLHEVAGEQVLTTAPTGETIGITPTPGHTPGHQSVVVDAGRDRLVVLGDVLVHAVQLVAPDVAYTFESDPDLARATRRAVLADAEARGTVLASPHLSEPFHRLARRTPPDRQELGGEPR